jgi:hypothetical protein
VSYIRKIHLIVLILCILVPCFVVGASKDYDDYLNRLTEQYKPTPVQDPSGSRRTAASAPGDFSVTSVKIKKSTPNPPRNILLITPIHRATYTTGMLTFAWKPKKKIRASAKYILTIESVDGTKRITKKSGREQKDLALDIGEYKWQVTCENGYESPWRHFKIIDMDAKNGVRDPSSAAVAAPLPGTFAPADDSDNEAADTSETDITGDAPADEGDSQATTHSGPKGPPLAPPKWVHVK